MATDQIRESSFQTLPFEKKKWRKSGYGNSVPLNFVNQGSNGRLLNEALLLAKRLCNARN